MAKRRFVTKSANSTRKLGEILGEETRGYFNRKKTGFCVSLEGELGSGKTVFAKGFARGLGIVRPVTSPTFVLAKRYPVTKSRFRNFWHVDCYRLKNARELKTIDMKNLCPTRTPVLLLRGEIEFGNIFQRKCFALFSSTKKNRGLRVSSRFMGHEKKTLVILDAHALIHRAYHALPAFTSPSGEPMGAVYGVCAFLIKLIRDIAPSHIAD